MSDAHPEFAHPCEAMTTPKPDRVFVVVSFDGDCAEDQSTWIAGVFTDRALAVAAAGDEPRTVIFPVPLNLFGRYWKP